jgi:hypothetical protein
VTYKQKDDYLKKYPSQKFLINQSVNFKKSVSHLDRISYCKDSLLLLDPKEQQVGLIIKYICNKIDIQFIHFGKEIKTEEKIEFILDTIELLVNDEGLALNLKDTLAEKNSVLLFNSKSTTAKKITYCLCSTYLLPSYNNLSIKLLRSLDQLIETLGEDIKTKVSDFCVNKYKQSQARMVIDNLAHCFNHMDEKAHEDFKDAKIIKILMKFLLDDSRIHSRKEAAKAIGNLAVHNKIHISDVCNLEICEGVFNLLPKMTEQVKINPIENDIIEHVMYLISILSVGFVHYKPSEQNAILNFILATLEVEHNRNTSMKKIYAINACRALTTIEPIAIEGQSEEKKVILQKCNQNLILFYENAIKFLVILARKLRPNEYEKNAVLVIIQLLNKQLSITSILDSGVIKLAIDVSNDEYENCQDDYLTVKKLLQSKGYTDVFNNELQKLLCINSSAGGDAIGQQSNRDNVNKKRKISDYTFKFTYK